MRLVASLMLLMILGGGCAPSTPPPPPVMPPAATAAFTLGMVTLEIAPGSAIGGYGFDLLCAPPYHDLVWNPPAAGGRALRAAALEGLAGAGMGPVAGTGAGLPVLSAHITAITYDLCRRRDFWFGRSIGDSGSVEVHVRWSLAVGGRTLITTQTIGTGSSDRPALRDMRQLLLGLALADAAGHLARQAEFRQALTVLETPPAAAFPAPMAGSQEMETPTSGEGEAPAADRESPLIRVRLGAESLPAIRIGTDGLALLRGGRREIPPAIGDPVTLAAGETGVIVASDGETGTALLRLAPCPCPGMEWRHRSPAISSPLHPPGAVSPVMVAARRESGTMTILLIDPGEVAPAPPFLLDAAGRLAAVRAGPAEAGGLIPYFPAGLVLTRLQAGMATAPDPRAPETQKAG